MAAVVRARLLVPIVTEPVSVDETGEHLVEKQTDMAAVTLVAPDGTRALPVFSSMSAITAWDPHARPVPVTAARAAQAAVSERCDVMVVDLAGPLTVALRPSMVWALAQQRDWLPAHQDETVRRAVAAAVREQEVVLAHEIGPEARGRACCGWPFDWPRALTRPPCRRSPPPSASGSPPMARSARGSTGSPSRSPEVAAVSREEPRLSVARHHGIDGQRGIQVGEGLARLGVADLLDGRFGEWVGSISSSSNGFV